MSIGIMDGKYQVESFYGGMSEPEGYGVCDQNDEDFCGDCGKPYDECNCLSPCCTAPIIHSDICSDYGEHCI